MPVVSFESLPDDARLWIFAASDPVIGDRAGQLLAAVDEWLADWKAHDEPLRCARDWRDDRFLAIGVDQSTAGASGCSIDALFRVLQQIQSSIGTNVVGGGRIFFRDGSGEIVVSSRHDFESRAASGAVHSGTRVFDTTVTTLDAYRSSFELPLSDSWHRELVPASSSSPSPSPSPSPSSQY